MIEDNNKLVDHLFRNEYGKLVASLTRFFGTANIQTAEDIVQETLLTALNHWPMDGIPENPPAWLMQVAKRKALNEIKRNHMLSSHHKIIQNEQQAIKQLDDLFLPHEIEDNELRMVFTCCHPKLSTSSQIALTLKTLCGFGVQEVANALLTNKSTINKRLYRAKQTLAEAETVFEIPSEENLKSRLHAVTTSLYLLFNEGYNSSVDDSIIRKDFCLEAIRLTLLLANHFQEEKQLFALLALMCFHTARFEARIDDKGAIILFEDQDRSLWNKDLILKGIHYLKLSKESLQLTPYHIEANIAAEHCLAQNFETTNWQNLFDLYQLLYKLKPNPIIQLNLAIIQGQIKGLEHSIPLLEKLTRLDSFKGYHLLPATQGITAMKTADYSSAIPYLEKALSLTNSSKEKAFLNQKIEECKSALKHKD